MHTNAFVMYCQMYPFVCRKNGKGLKRSGNAQIGEGEEKEEKEAGGRARCEKRK